ncbi:MAG: hypothetical protein HY391_05600 [Deltaproteobacteria bacterium]|nr:hypothetical protein [Deltaproteobacteria bacterium]
MPKFIADKMLGRLAKWLRFMGFDVIEAKREGDEDLHVLALQEERVILTRDRILAQAIASDCSLLIPHESLDDQIRFVVHALEISAESVSEQILTRCSSCNTLLVARHLSEVEERVPDYPRRHKSRFWECSTCHRVFWEGTHYDRIQKVIRGLL